MAFDLKNLNLTKDFKTDVNDLSNQKAKKQTFISFDKLIQSKASKEIFLVDDSYKESIAEDGLLSPFVVKRLDDERYEILSGNKRYEAFKALIKNEGFKYRYMGKQLLDPKADGIPCLIVERDLTASEEALIIIESNKSRNFDNLEIYKMVKKTSEIYEELKNNGLIKYGSGSKTKWIANRVSISERTISTILLNHWLITSFNYDEIIKCGSYKNYWEQLLKKRDELGRMPKKQTAIKNSPFDKEWKYQDKIEKHYNKLDFEKIYLKEGQYGDLRENAIQIIKSIMNAYDVHTKELK